MDISVMLVNCKKALLYKVLRYDCSFQEGKNAN